MLEHQRNRLIIQQACAVSIEDKNGHRRSFPPSDLWSLGQFLNKVTSRTLTFSSSYILVSLFQSLRAFCDECLGSVDQ